MLDPDGQGVPEGAKIIPPETVQPLSQKLFVMLAFAGEPVNEGHDCEGAIATPL